MFADIQFYISAGDTGLLWGHLRERPSRRFGYNIKVDFRERNGKT
jgi:hypothetical protein